MADIELKGNSFKENAQSQSEDIQEKKSVVKGTVKQKKVSAGKQFIDNFVNEDKETIKSHILFDIIIPAVKDMIFNGFQSALDMLLYGGDGSRRVVTRSDRRRVVSSGATNYNAISNQRNSRVQAGASRERACDQLEFEERTDALAVLNELNDQLDEFGMVSAYDLFDAAGVDTNNYALKNWGWHDLTSARVERTREGTYIINLPKMEVIK